MLIRDLPRSWSRKSVFHYSHRVTEYFLLIFNPEEACMVCFLLQNPLNPMIELFIQKHLAKSCGAKDRKAKSQSVNQFNIDSQHDLN